MEARQERIVGFVTFFKVSPPFFSFGISESKQQTAHESQDESTSDFTRAYLVSLAAKPDLSRLSDSSVLPICFEKFEAKDLDHHYERVRYV